MIVTVLAFICYTPFLSNYRMFCFDNDHYTQYEYFYKEWNRLICGFFENGSFPFYSFNSFLGNNYYASKAFHVTGDILYPLMCFFQTVNEGLAFQAYILTIISSLLMYAFLKKFGVKKENVIYVTVIFFVFGGLSIHYLNPASWKRAYTLLPFVFYAIEDYRETNKIIFISIAVFLGFITNYYFMFPITIFSIFYFIFTNLYHYEDIKPIEIIVKIPKAILGYVVGFLLSGILMIPTLLFMFNNPRVGSGITFEFFYDVKVYLGYFFNMFIDKRNMMYDNYFTMNDNGHLSQYTGYINSVIMPCAFSYLFIRKKKSNRNIFVMKNFVIICFLLPLCPLLSSIMHGFSGASMRWIFLTSFILLLAFAVFFDCDSIDKKIILKGLVLCTIVYLLLIIIGRINNIIIDLFSFTIISAFLALVLNYLYALLLYRESIDKVFIISSAVCITMSCINMKDLNNSYEFYNDSLDRDAIKYLEDINDDKFYRMEINTYNVAPYINPLNLNTSINYSYKSTSAYDSTYEGNLSEFLEMNGIYNHIINITNPECLRMLGVKYFYVLDESELPKEFNYTYVTNNNNWKVYQLDDYRSLGFTYSTFTSDKNEIVNNNSWNNVLLITDELKNQIKDIEPINSVNLNIIEFYDDNNLVGTIELENKQALFLSIPYNDGWKIKDNGELIETYKVQGGFIGVILDPGFHYIELNFMPPGFKSGVIASGTGFIALIISYILEKKKARVVS